MSPHLSEESIFHCLHENKLDDFRLLYAQEMPSTNLIAKQAAVQGLSEDALVICGRQTAGRGRMQRQWVSAENESLTFSVLFTSRLSAEKMHMYTLAAGMAVFRAIRDIAPELQPGIKWPNDVVLHGRKCCGILCEAAQTDAKGQRVVLGIGININQREFPQEISEKATSLLLETKSKEEINLPAVLASVLVHLRGACRQLEEQLPAFLADYLKASVTVGQKVKVESPAETYAAEAVGVDEDGCLLVKRESGEVTAVQCGDVSVRGIMGYC